MVVPWWYSNSRLLGETLGSRAICGLRFANYSGSTAQKQLSCFVKKRCTLPDKLIWSTSPIELLGCDSNYARLTLREPNERFSVSTRDSKCESLPLVSVDLRYPPILLFQRQVYEFWLGLLKSHSPQGDLKLRFSTDLEHGRCRRYHSFRENFLTKKFPNHSQCRTPPTALWK